MWAGRGVGWRARVGCRKGGLARAAALVPVTCQHPKHGQSSAGIRQGERGGKNDDHGILLISVVTCCHAANERSRTPSSLSPAQQHLGTRWVRVNPMPHAKTPAPRPRVHSLCISLLHNGWSQCRTTSILLIGPTQGFANFDKASQGCLLRTPSALSRSFIKRLAKKDAAESSRCLSSAGGLHIPILRVPSAPSAGPFGCPWRPSR